MLEINFHIEETEIASYAAWKIYLTTPVAQRQATGDLIAMSHKIKEALDGYGVDLKDVIPVTLSRHKDQVKMKFKYVEAPQANK